MGTELCRVPIFHSNDRGSPAELNYHKNSFVGTLIVEVSGRFWSSPTKQLAIEYLLRKQITFFRERASKVAKISKHGNFLIIHSHFSTILKGVFNFVEHEVSKSWKTKRAFL